MTSQELREKFLKFFEKNDHKIIPSASLIPSEEEQLAGKEKVLFTSAGMQPLIPYLTGQKEPPSKRLVNVQKCLRTDDIEEVGDEIHHTFFEMLGNWSIGDYWKEEAVRLSFEFLTKELEIPIEKLAITVFAGDEDAPKDEESAGVWKSLGIPEDRIFYFGKSHNWWPTARGEQDSGEYKNLLGPCGPDTEMFYWIGEGRPTGKPNEDSGWVEIWNDVFMEFNRKEDGTLEELPQKNVDTGMGLERTVAVLNGKKSDYETDLFESVISVIIRKYFTGIIDSSMKLDIYPVNPRIYSSQEEETENKKKTQRSVRIIADHMKAATFLIKDGVIPSNKLGGYILRRLLRRSAVKLYFLMKKNIILTEDLINLSNFHRVSDAVIDIYGGLYFDPVNDKKWIGQIVDDEIDNFRKTLEEGIRALKKIFNRAFGGIDPENLPIGMRLQNNRIRVSGAEVFKNYETFGLPPEIQQEIMTEWGLAFDSQTVKEYEEAMQHHQQVSRGVEAGKFKGGLVDHSEIVTKYHTATHLLHQALRDVLGSEVFQKGSNITAERLRFDFSFDRKMTDEEIKQVENLVNKKIEEDLKVDRKIVSPDEAKKMNAIGLFDEKYGTEVSIYGVGPGYRLDPDARDQRDRGGYYSLEFCGGPHVEHTGVIGKIKITKEEAVSSGIRRIRAEIVIR